MTEIRHIHQQHQKQQHHHNPATTNQVLRHSHSDPVTPTRNIAGGAYSGDEEQQQILSSSKHVLLPILPLASKSPLATTLPTQTTTKTVSAGGVTNVNDLFLSSSSTSNIMLPSLFYSWIRTSLVVFIDEMKQSVDPIFNTKLTILLMFGPAAILNESTNTMSEYWSFLFAGMALIPCAERLSFITEQVAEHTNSTVGALLNATFGNAPELLISVAALRSGYYRVVQLAMLGSMLTNLMFVFGVACIIGGCRYQVQHIRQSSGNVSVLLLLVATAGSLLPAALVLSGQFPSPESDSKDDTNNYNNNNTLLLSSTTHTSDNASSFYQRKNPDVPSQEEVTLCRVNAAVMLILYFCYLIFQMGTHKEEFDDEESITTLKNHAKRNVACQKIGRFIINVFTKPSRLFRNLSKRRFSYAELSNLDYSTTTANHGSEMNDDTIRSDGDLFDEEQINDYKISNKSPILHRKKVNNKNKLTIHTTNNEDLLTSTHDELESIDLLAGSLHMKEKRKLSDGINENHITSLLGVQQRRQPRTGHAGTNHKNNIHHNDKVHVPKKNVLHSSSCKSKSSDILTDDEEIDEDDPDENYDEYMDITPMNSSGEHMINDISGRSGGSGLVGIDSSSIMRKHHHGGLGNSKIGLSHHDDDDAPILLLSLRVGVVWLFIITLCISAMSDILVDTIGGFADKMNLSQVFTSMVIIPFFSNVAEQVSAFLFAYRNEMDLCVGVTVGSAIQIATMVLPGSVLIGMVLDRNMTLYFHTFETVCLFFGVVVVAVILQSGTTNWLVGAMLVGIYTMFAAGVWFHELEDLSVDLEEYGTSG